MKEREIRMSGRKGNMFDIKTSWNCFVYVCACAYVQCDGTDFLKISKQANENRYGEKEINDSFYKMPRKQIFDEGDMVKHEKRESANV